MIYLLEEYEEFDSKEFFVQQRNDLGYFTTLDQANNFIEKFIENAKKKKADEQLRMQHYYFEISHYPELKTEQDLLFEELFGEGFWTVSKTESDFAFEELPVLKAVEIKSGV